MGLLATRSRAAASGPRPPAVLMSHGGSGTCEGTRPSEGAWLPRHPLPIK